MKHPIDNQKIIKRKVEKFECILTFKGKEVQLMLRMDGFNDCIVGSVERFGQEPIICYDKNKVLKKNMQDGMSEEESIEYFEYNQLGAWVGDTTPCFLTKGGD